MSTESIHKHVLLYGSYNQQPLAPLTNFLQEDGGCLLRGTNSIFKQAIVSN